MSDDAPYDYAAAAREGAKAVQKATDLVRDFGGYLASVSESVPQSALGIINDRLKLFRAEQAIGYYARLKQTVEKAGLDASKIRPPTPSIEILLIEAATLEDREDLQDLWDRLLAAAVLPQTRNRVRARHIEILKKLEPLDALLLENFEKITSVSGVMNRVTFLQEATKQISSAGQIEMEISFFALADLGLIYTGMSPDRLVTVGPPFILAQGRDFLFVIRRQY